MRVSGCRCSGGERRVTSKSGSKLVVATQSACVVPPGKTLKAARRP